MKMKKSLLIFAAALMLAACGQKDNQQEQPEQPQDKEEYVFTGVPVAPMQHIEVPIKGGVDPTALGDLSLIHI